MKKATYQKNIFGHSAIFCALLLILYGNQAKAEQMVFSNAPAVNSHKPPAPNVIISIDDSGSMSGNKMTTLKAALQDTFKEENIPDGVIRLAWQGMNRCTEIPSNNSGCANNNGMRILDSDHRKKFLNWIQSNNLKASGGTPSHNMLDKAGQYLMSENLGKNSPWASVPGSTTNPVLSCRRSYSIFLTDGGWNGSTNQTNDEDNVKTDFPDNKKYDPNNSQSRIYRGIDSKRFADLAFKYWSTDLQPSIANGITPSINQSGNINISSGGKSFTLEEYWNPRNNPATWQHLTLYTIGFGEGAATWTAFPKWGTDTWTGADFDSIIVGDKKWGSNTLTDMWHAAINSRGKFVPVKKNSDLAPAFREILEDIMVQASKPLTSIKLSASTTRADSYSYTAGYDPANWIGQVNAYKIKEDTGVYDSVHVWGSDGNNPHSTQTLLDQKAQSNSNFHKNRIIWSSKLGTISGNTEGIHFNWNNLTQDQKDIFNAGDGRGDKRVDFIRGDRSEEKSALRERTSLHGDIVGSNVWLTPDYVYGSKTGKKTRPSVLYVGANDGMMHAFDAKTGHEIMAYIPRGLFSKLVDFTNRGYTHTYYVDGSPFTSEVNIGNNTYKDYLVGFLGAGGRGYFVLDVTEPEKFSTTDPKSKIILDNTENPDADIGHVFSSPTTDLLNERISTQITRLNDGRWALVTGNGYNSSNERPVLLIQYLDGNKELKKIIAKNDIDQANGLSAPRLVDLSGDGIPDVAYAGDLKGNLWKFDLSSESNNNWKVAFNGAPLIKTGKSIVTTPAYSFHSDSSVGGLMIMFGTGRNLTQEDWTSTTTQRIYGIHDPTKWTNLLELNSQTDTSKIVLDESNHSLSDLTKLVKQEFTKSNEKIGENSAWTVSDNNVDYNDTNAQARDRGWYVDLTTLVGARVLRNIEYFSGKTYKINFTVPAQNTDKDNDEETCIAKYSAGVEYLAYLNIENGSYPTNGVFEGNSTNLVIIETPDGFGKFMTGPDGNPISIGGGGGGPRTKLTKWIQSPIQPSWKSLQ